MAEVDQFVKLVENLYIVERVVNAMEKRPRYYNTEQMLYANEVHTLKHIALSEGITQTELTDKTFRTKGATSIILNKLESKGLVEKRHDVQDARLIRLYLTDKGKTVNNCHTQFDEEKISDWEKMLKFSEKDLRTTNSTLEALLHFIKEYTL